MLFACFERDSQQVRTCYRLHEVPRTHRTEVTMQSYMSAVNRFGDMLSVRGSKGLVALVIKKVRHKNVDFQRNLAIALKTGIVENGHSK
jgi:elongation factor P--beta-lysine ligase